VTDNWREGAVNKGPWDGWLPGVLTKSQVRELVRGGFIRGASTASGDLDYSSIDLRIAGEAYELTACVKPFGRDFLGALRQQKLATPVAAQADDSYVLTRRHSYLFRLMERIPEFNGTPIYGSATAKSSIGRMDVLARLIVDGMDEYEGFEPDKACGGDMFLEVTPMTFNVRVKPGIALTQLRLYKGRQVESLIRGQTLLATVFDGHSASAGPTLSVDLSPDVISGIGVSAFSAPLQQEAPTGVIDLWNKPEDQKPKPWEHWKFEVVDENRRLRIVKDRFYIIRSRERIHLPKGIAVYCRASDETIGEMRIHYAGFVHPFFGLERDDGTRGTPLIFEVRGHDIDVSLMDQEKMARLEFYRMSEDAVKDEQPGRYSTQSLQLSKFFAAWPPEADCTNGIVTPK
jgi:dCTP deaminase